VGSLGKNGGDLNEAILERTRAGVGTYAGLFFVTLSTLMYEILLTRIFSVTMWFHFAFVAVSVALFGMTVGALIVYLLPGRFPHERTKERLAQASLLFSLSIVVSFVTQLSIPFDPQWSVIGVYSVVFTYLVISVPFIFSGVAVCLSLTRFPSQVGRLYAADLVGAALGALTVIWLLDLLHDGPSAVLAIAAFPAVGTVLFAVDAGRTRYIAFAAMAALLLSVMAAGNALSVQQHHPILRVRWVRGHEEEAVPLFETWNAYSRIVIGGDPAAPPGEPFGWGLSPTYASGAGVRQLLLNIDVAAYTVLTGYDGNPESVEHLRYDVTNVAHHIRAGGDVFVIGSGGGRDVLTALLFDQRSVTAVEINGDILEAVNGRFGDFTGHLDRQPGVKFVNDEARSYLARSDDRFDIIQLSFVDTWAATAAGSFALSENGLYTVEAFEIFLDHLTEDGVLSVSRWYMAERPLEAYRLTSLATAALRERGIEEPRRHMVMIRGPERYPPVAVGTLLLSARPFSTEDILKLRSVAAEMQFEVALAPDGASDPNLERIAAGDLDGVELDVPANISPPTDDKPFFFQMVDFWDLLGSNTYREPFLTRPMLVLFSLLLTVLVLTALFILGPLLLTTKRSALRGMAPYMAFFAAIGLGFILIEISQMQRLMIFLGHPTYALSVVLFSLLLFSGLGSLATEGLEDPSPDRGMRWLFLWPLAVLLLILLTFGFVTPVIIDRFEAATTTVRILTSVLILAPMGLVMGMPFPLGMKVASMRPNAPTAFFWGINGATSVCASVLAVAIALGWGISAAFWVGCVSYAVATAALGLVIVRGRV
jgi:hypothetical protein